MGLAFATLAALPPTVAHATKSKRPPTTKNHGVLSIGKIKRHFS
jgi:hypothetical protein